MKRFNIIPISKRLAMPPKTLLFIFMFVITSVRAFGWEYPNVQITSLPYEEGLGTKDNPYVINNAQQLADLAWYVNHGTSYSGQYFILGQDIDLNPGFIFQKDGTIIGEGTPKQWVPIGTSNNNFKANFDGQGHTIKGLYQDSLVLDTKTYACMGLFGKTSCDTLCNIKFTNSLLSINGQQLDGILNVGFLAGEIESGVFYGCTNDASIYISNLGDNTNPVIGGIVGSCSSLPSTDRTCKIWNCTNSGNIKVTSTLSIPRSQVGGICGESYELSLMENCSNSGEIVSDYDCGGIMCTAWNPAYSKENPSALRNLVNTGNITGTYSIGGIIAGSSSGSSFGVAEKCLNKGIITSTGSIRGMVGGLFGQLLTHYIKDCHNEGNVYGGSGMVDYTYAFEINDCSNIGNIDNGSGLVGGAMYLTNVRNCYNTGKVTGGTGLIGGIAGDGTDQTLYIEKCYNKGNVEGRAGLLGSFSHYVVCFKNCYNEGDINYIFKKQDENKYVAGLVPYGGYGATKVQIDSCYNSGNITCNGKAAGLTGNQNSVTISNSFNKGDIKGAEFAAGLCERGAIKITNSYNEGNIQSDGDAVGLTGNFGFSTEVEYRKIFNCYNAGEIRGGKSVCGIAKEDYPQNINITNVFNYGKLNFAENSTNADLYGIANFYNPIDNVFSNCYYLQQEGIVNLTNGVAKTAEDFASGKLCVLLNEGQNPSPWGQEVNSDLYPKLNGKGNPIISGINHIYKTEKYSDNLYDMMGNVVESPSSKGIYIRNGQKIVLGK